MQPLNGDLITAPVTTIIMLQESKKSTFFPPNFLLCYSAYPCESEQLQSLKDPARSMGVAPGVANLR